jgi:tetratricopeptide (TPR) repeat protein
MTPRSQVTFPHSRSIPRWLGAAVACVALTGGVSAPTQAGIATTHPAGEQPVDQERRNREFQHAEALYLSGRYKEAAAEFERLSRAYPRDARIWLKYGNTLTKQGSYDNAAVAFQTALSLDPDLGGAALNLALVHLAEAQDALGAAVNRLAAGTPERAQAEGLQQQLNSLLGAPGPAQTR